MTRRSINMQGSSCSKTVHTRTACRLSPMGLSFCRTSISSRRRPSAILLWESWETVWTIWSSMRNNQGMLPILSIRLRSTCWEIYSKTLCRRALNLPLRCWGNLSPPRKIRESSLSWWICIYCWLPAWVSWRNMIKALVSSKGQFSWKWTNRRKRNRHSGMIAMMKTHSIMAGPLWRPPSALYSAILLKE